MLCSNLELSQTLKSILMLLMVDGWVGVVVKLVSLVKTVEVAGA